MTAPFSRTRIAIALTGLALTLGAGQASGAAFALAEQNVMGLGNAFAGAAATAEDANTVWFNPAGLARLNLPQVEAAVHFITPSAKFHDEGSKAALGQPLGGNGGDAGGTAIVPNMYGSMAINDEWHLGLGVNAPFGLKTEYDNGWLGRYQALKSEVKTININPAVGWRATKDFWVGAGADYQQFKATLTNNVNYTAALAQGYGQAAAAGVIPASSVPALIGATSGLDSFVSTKGDDWSWGWNVGAMYSIGGDANNDNGAARIGLSYRSKIKFNVVGNVNITNPTVPTLTGALAPFNPVVQGLSSQINQSRLYNGGRRPRRGRRRTWRRCPTTSDSTTRGISSPTSRGPAGAASSSSRSCAPAARTAAQPPCCRSITRTRGGCRGASTTSTPTRSCCGPASPGIRRRSTKRT